MTTFTAQHKFDKDTIVTYAKVINQITKDTEYSIIFKNGERSTLTVKRFNELFDIIKNEEQPNVNIIIHRRFENQRRYISINDKQVGWALKDRFGNWEIHSKKRRTN